MSPRAKKRVRHEEPTSDSEDSSFEKSFDTMLTLLNKMDEGKLKDFEGITNIRTAITKTCDTTREFINLLEQDPGLDVKAISFSRFNTTNLTTRLGVVIQNIDSSETPDSLVGRFAEGLQEGFGTTPGSSSKTASPSTTLNIMKVVDDHSFTSFQDSFELIFNSVNIRPEARARMLIDQWLLESMRISQKLDQGYSTIIFPEFQISSLSSEPAKIIYEKDGVTFITYITGSIDYDYALTSFPEQKIASTTHKELVESTQFTPVTFISEYESFTFVEAKKKDEDLHRYIPQVAAQCLAMCEKGMMAKDGNIEKMR